MKTGVVANESPSSLLLRPPGWVNDLHHEVTGYISLSLSLLTWFPYIGRVLNIGGWSSLPGAEASGALGIVPVGLHVTLYPICQTSAQSSLVLLVISVPSLHPTLPYSPSDSSVPAPLPSLLHARRYLLDIQNGLLPPSPG